jgi:hypothetical protein
MGPPGCPRTVVVFKPGTPKPWIYTPPPLDHILDDPPKDPLGVFLDIPPRGVPHVHPLLAPWGILQGPFGAHSALRVPLGTPRKRRRVVVVYKS